METKLRELQEKLAIEEADKVHLQEQLNKTLDSEDLQRLQIQFDGEKQRRVDLELQLAKMNQLLSTGQEALQQEQKTVDMLRQQVTSAPSSTSSGSANAAAKATNAMTTNGQDEVESASSCSQIGSVASLELHSENTTPVKDKKKSKKKKLLGFFK